MTLIGALISIRPSPPCRGMAMPMPAAKEGSGKTPGPSRSPGCKSRLPARGWPQWELEAQAPRLRLPSGQWERGWAQAKTSYLMPNFGAICAMHFILFSSCDTLTKVRVPKILMT